MLGVGFEPTRTNTGDLKSLPLDQLGHPSAPVQSSLLLSINNLFGCVMTCVLLGRTSLSYWVELPLALIEPFDIIYKSLSHTL